MDNTIPIHGTTICRNCNEDTEIYRFAENYLMVSCNCGIEYECDENGQQTQILALWIACPYCDATFDSYEEICWSCSNNGDYDKS